MSINDLVGKTLTEVLKEGGDGNYDNHQLKFVMDDGKTFCMFHRQDCCEHVYIESIVGDLEDLVGVPILTAEERSNTSDIIDPDFPKTGDESYTWTFYTIRTIKGSVDIRWYGSSNGYYSEDVTFCEEGKYAY